jgi:hypothetical protein
VHFTLFVYTFLILSRSTLTDKFSLYEKTIFLLNNHVMFAVHASE